MTVLCSWYLRRRAQRGQSFFTTAWQLWWKTVLHSPHLGESGKCSLCQWAGGLPWDLRLASFRAQTLQSGCVLPTTAGMWPLLLLSGTREPCSNASPRSRDAHGYSLFHFYKSAETHYMASSYG